MTFFHGTRLLLIICFFSFFFLFLFFSRINKYAFQFIMNETDIFPLVKQPTSKNQQESLGRIVKAQVTLLVSNLDNDNFTRKAAEINSVSFFFKNKNPY